MPASIVGLVQDENGNQCTVKTALKDIAASTTDSSIVAAVTGKRIRVLAYSTQCGGTATTLVFNSKGAGAGTAISSTQQPAANGGRVANQPLGGFWFQTNAGEALTATTGSGSQTGVEVIYIEV